MILKEKEHIFFGQKSQQNILFILVHYSVKEFEHELFLRKKVVQEGSLVVHAIHVNFSVL
jgi:hypothetical protein